jgi:hypothetical protein
MADRDAKKKRRTARLKKARNISRNKPAPKFTIWERQAMDYHARVMKGVENGDWTLEEAKAELESASKDAADNLAAQKAPEILVTVVEQLILYGSYEGLQAAAQRIEAAKHDHKEG